MKLSDINVRDPFIFVENGVTYLYRTLSQNPTEGDDYGLCVFVSTDGENFEKKVIFRANADFWGEICYWAPEMHKIDGKYYLFGSFYKFGRCRASHILVCDTPDGTFVPLPEALTPPAWECLDATYFEDNGKRYTVFCHEWSQCEDGEIVLGELNDEFRIVGEPKVLFRASEAPWTCYHDHPGAYVTDGPFIHRMSNGELLMLWSSFETEEDASYAMGMAKATSPEGPWVHADKPLITGRNAGHGMLFEKDGRLFVTYHSPNGPVGAEHACIVEVMEQDGWLAIVN